MKEEYLAVFHGMETQIRESGELPWLVATIDGVAASLDEWGFILRADAFVFLYDNLKVMVVTPWMESREQSSDAREIAPIIQADLQQVLRQVMENDSDKVVSANAAFQAIAELSKDLMVRAEGFWGP